MEVARWVLEWLRRITSERMSEDWLREHGRRPGA
jgi:hypothetical protein